jgi:hypothetical protein
MQLFEHFMANGQQELAIELLRTMQKSQLILGAGDGIRPTVRGFENQPGKRADTLASLESLQRLIDNKWRTDELQDLYEQLLLNSTMAEVEGFDDGLGMFEQQSRATRMSAVGRGTTPPVWRRNADLQHPLVEAPTPLNMYNQLVQLARTNGELTKLRNRVRQAANPSTRENICNAIITCR